MGQVGEDIFFYNLKPMSNFSVIQLDGEWENVSF